MNEEKQTVVKDEIIAYISSLPGDITLDKIIYHLTVKQKIANGLEDIRHGRTKSHEEVKKLMEKRFRAQEEQLGVETMLIACCKMRGNPTSLIHRTIHEFNWFYQNLIFEKSKIINNEYFKVTDSDLVEQIANRNIPQDDNLTLRSVVHLFFLYCKHIYDA